MSMTDIFTTPALPLVLLAAGLDIAANIMLARRRVFVAVAWVCWPLRWWGWLSIAFHWQFVIWIWP